MRMAEDNFDSIFDASAAHAETVFRKMDRWQFGLRDIRLWLSKQDA